MAKSFTIRIVTPFGLYKEFKASMINFRTTDGNRGLLADHMPYVAILPISSLTTIDSEGKREIYAVGDGMIHFKNNFCKVLVDVIESEDEIDANRALAAKERALKRINHASEQTDLQRAELALKKAMNRIAIIEKSR